MITTTYPALDAVVAVLILVGTVFLVVGALGLIRFDDFFMRLHAPTKATTLGVGGVLLASMLCHLAWGQGGVHELLITLFLFVTAPVSASLMAKAALHRRLRSKAGHRPVTGDRGTGVVSPTADPDRR